MPQRRQEGGRNKTIYVYLLFSLCCTSLLRSVDSKAILEGTTLEESFDELDKDNQCFFPTFLADEGSDKNDFKLMKSGTQIGSETELTIVYVNYQGDIIGRKYETTYYDIEDHTTGYGLLLYSKLPCSDCTPSNDQVFFLETTVNGLVGMSFYYYEFTLNATSQNALVALSVEIISTTNGTTSNWTNIWNSNDYNIGGHNVWRSGSVSNVNDASVTKIRFSAKHEVGIDDIVIDTYGPTTSPNYPACDVNERRFDHKLYKFLFKEKCARSLSFCDGQDKCAVADINKALGAMLQYWQIDGYMLNIFSIIFMIMLLQVGGIPPPNRENFFDRFFFWIWMFLVALQVLFSLVMIFMVIFSYVKLRSEIGDCAVSWGYGHMLIDVLMFQSFAVQGALFTPVVLLYINLVVLSEGSRLYKAVHDDTESKGEILDLLFAFIDLALGFTLLVYIASATLCGFFFIVSLSWLFSFLIFAPIIGFYILFTSFIAVFLKNNLFKPFGASETMLWWSSMDEDGNLINKSINFNNIFYSVLSMVFAPIAVFGIAYTTHIYSNHNSTHFIGHLYDFTFSCFTNSDTCFQYSITLDFNLARIPQAFDRLVDVLMNGFGGYSADDFLSASRDCSLFAFLLSILKSCIAFLELALSFYTEALSSPIPFYKLAVSEQGEEMLIVDDFTSNNNGNKFYELAETYLGVDLKLIFGNNGGDGGGKKNASTTSKNNPKEVEMKVMSMTNKIRQSSAPDSTRRGNIIRRHYEE